MSTNGPAKEAYSNLSKERAQYLERARHNALVTLPSLMPVEGRMSQAHLVEPYQSLGAMGVTHLSSRMAIGLIPAGRPFMRFDLPPEVAMTYAGEIPTDVTIGLSKAEALVQSEVEEKGWREATLMSLQQLLVAGNVVELILPDNTIRQYRLDQFVQQFDLFGKLVRLIICEHFPASEAPTGLKLPENASDDQESVELYTDIKRKSNGDYTRHQEWSNGEKVGTTTTFTEEQNPYITLGWTHQPGENYARAKVTEHAAGLRSLDNLEKAQLEMSAMASRNFVMVRPGAAAASVRRRLVQAINGDVLVGDPEGVELKSFDNVQGAQLTAAQIQILREELSRAFLLLSGAAQRNAERVTATEIERDVAELEAALGGVFSSLAQKMMKRRTVLLTGRMVVQEKLPPFPEGMVVPTILTGLEALSRERDVSRAMQAGQVVQAFGEKAVEVVKLERILARAFVGLGFADSTRTEEEVAQIQQQNAEARQQEMMMEKMGPEVIKQAGAQQGGGGVDG